MSTSSTTSTSSAVEAEAIGRDTVDAPFGGQRWSIPADADTWPLDLVGTAVGMAQRRVLPNHGVIVEALSGILGHQFDRFVAQAAPRRKDLVPASMALATAAGFPASDEVDHNGDPRDRAFGGLPRLLSVLRLWPDAVESDLNRFWQLDYRDRWRFDDDGRRKLTLRQIYARVSHLPADSALAVAMGRRSPSELLLMDIYEPLAGRVHPSRPLTPEQLRERRAEADAKKKALADYEARRAARGDRIKTGLENARANATLERSATSGQENRRRFRP